MLRIHLVLVPPVIKGKFAELGEGLTPPLGILSIASYLRARMNGVEIKVTDGLLEGFTRTAEIVSSWKPHIVGLSFNTPVANSAYALFETLRSSLPEAILVAGGAHTTSLPDEVLTKSKADIAVIGEGEETFLAIVKTLAGAEKIDKRELFGLNGIAFAEGGKVTVNPIAPYIPELDSIQFPARDLVDMKRYSGWYLTKKKPETTMLFSRGCAYQCVFCSNKVWNVSQPCLRFRSPANIADEIVSLNEEFGIKEVFDNSDEFNNSLSHAKEVCREMIKRNLRIPWKTQLRVWPLDDELASLMAAAGCWYVHLGIESASQRTLDGVKKKITIEQAIEACRILKRYKIKVLGLFMLFNIWEENEVPVFEGIAESRATLDFAGKLIRKGLINYMGWSITMPYPGSPLYDIALRNNLIKDGLAGNWDAWLREEFSVIKLPGITDKDIARLKTRGSVLRALAMIRSGGFGLSDAGYIMKKLMRIVANEIPFIK
ncbi:MAG: cobalamin-dependent protein [Fibrobacteres bacterium]|nr:cobalamin-dependent protein [Fibrobacterota bacterium]